MYVHEQGNYSFTTSGSPGKIIIRTLFEKKKKKLFLTWTGNFLYPAMIKHNKDRLAARDTQQWLYYQIKGNHHKVGENTFLPGVRVIYTSVYVTKHQVWACGCCERPIFNWSSVMSNVMLQPVL